MKNILIIGCGLIGSSLLRAILQNKVTKKIFVYEKSKSNISKIRNFKYLDPKTSLYELSPFQKLIF